MKDICLQSHYNTNISKNQYNNSTKVLKNFDIFFVRFSHTSPVTDNQITLPPRRQDVREKNGQQ